MSMFGLPAALIVLAMAAPSSHAPSPDEEKAFAEGLRLFDAGDARGAERVWKAGYAVGHDPAFLVRIGEAEEKAGAPREALQSYEQYLRASPDAADRADVESRIGRLGSGRPPSAAGPRTEIDADVPGEIAPPTGSGPGTGARPGSPTTAPTTSSSPATLPGRPQAQDDGSEDLRPIVDEDQPTRSRLNTVAWLATAATALLLGVAAYYGASAADKAGDANRLLTYFDQRTNVPLEYAQHAQQFEDDVRVGRHDDRVAKGLLIGAGVTTLAATVLFVVDSATGKAERNLGARTDGQNRRLAIAPYQIPSGSGWGLSWNF